MTITLSRTAAIRATADKIQVYRSGYNYAVCDERGQTVTLPDYWRAQAVATKRRAELALRLMGLDAMAAQDAVEQAIGRGYTTVRDIVAVSE